MTPRGRERIYKWLHQRPYAWVLLYLPCYLSYFAWLQTRTPEAVIIESSIDQMIPTVPLFFIPYALWWGLFPGALLYFLHKDKADFLKLCFVLFGGYTVCLFVYTVAPNGLQLREPLAGSDLCTKGILWLRSIDPPYNVCPSMHVSSTVAIDLTTRSSRHVPRWGKWLISIIAFLIILSTMFIKQHSVIDVIWGFLVSVALYGLWQMWQMFRR